MGSRVHFTHKAVQLAWTALAILAFMATYAAAAPLPGGSLDPVGIKKYVSPLVVPKVMPKAKSPVQGVDYYEIAMRQFEQQVLPRGLPRTTLWGYGAAGRPATFHSPALTIEAQVDKPVRVKWINDLKDRKGNFLPHILPVDQTLMWANPAMDCADGIPRTECHGSSQATYTGPVPMISHLHGAHVSAESDGHPNAWYLPAAKNIPQGYAQSGMNFGQIAGVPIEAGAAVFQYPNDQRPTTLWFHDHTMGMTRTNVYAGPAGFYLLRGGEADLSQGLPSGKYEVPLLIQDKSFNSNGSLFYPDSRAFFDGFAGPFSGDTAVESDVPPIWNPEFFGNTIVVNGNTWPVFKAEPRRYRFRVLNGSDSRFFILKLVKGSPTGTETVPFWQVGSDGGFLPAPVELTQLLVGPAERADVVVDLSSLANTEVYLVNVGPDEPFGGGVPGVDFAPSDPDTTGQVMKIVVARRAVRPTKDTTVNPANLVLPARNLLGEATNTRKVSLNEAESTLVCLDAGGSVVPCPPPLDGAFVAPVAAHLGTVNLDGTGNPLEFEDAVTETPALNATEIWEIYNFTEDAHPIHLHLVQFEVVNREDAEGTVTPPEPWETGTKDTVIVYPGGITRVKATFDIAGDYIWHCHILSHEDNEMMRPFEVVVP